MLPQKLGLDVVVEQSTGNLVTVEINGEDSGYDGLTSLGVNVSDRITRILGSALKRGQSILVNRGSAVIDKNQIGKLRDEFGISANFSLLVDGRVKLDVLEAGLGTSLEDFAGLVGFGSYLLDSGLDARMINSPAVELVTQDKLLQYELLKDIEELNLPQTWFFSEAVFPTFLEELQMKYGRLVKKERHGSQGHGVTVVEGDKFHTPTIVRMAQFAHKLNPESAEKLERRLMKIEETGVLIQRFVDTRSVIYEKTGQPHFGRARLIWFGGYVGGYWALSAKPVDDNRLSNAIVNFSRSHLSQQFTPEEAKMFGEYAEQVVPLVLQRLSPYNGRTGEYKGIEERLMREAILKRPSDIVSQQQR